MILKELTNEEFKNFSLNFRPSSMYQTTNYAFTMNEENCDSIFLGLKNNDTIKAASLILIAKIRGFKYALAPRGYLIDYSDFDLVKEFTKEIKKYLSKKDVVAIKISPLIIRNIYDSSWNITNTNSNYDQIFKNLTDLKYYHMGYNNYFEALKPRYEAILNLDLPYTTIFANIKKQFRTKIRKANNDGIIIYHGKKNDLEYLYSQTKDKYPRDLKYFQDLYKYFDKDNLIDFYFSKLDTTAYLKKSQEKYSEYERLSANLNKEFILSKGLDNKIMEEKLTVDKQLEKYRKKLAMATSYLKEYPQGIILSCALVVKWQDEVYLIIDSFDNNYRGFNSKHLLLWKLIGRYSKLGFKRFNLGGITNLDKEVPKYQGLNEFKLNFNSKAYEYIGDFELITNGPLYFMYQKSASLGKF